MADRMSLSRTPVIRDRLQPLGRDVEEVRTRLRLAVDCSSPEEVARRLRSIRRAVVRWCRDGEDIPEWVRSRIILLDVRLRAPDQFELRLPEPRLERRAVQVPTTAVVTALTEPAEDARPGLVIWWARIVARLSQDDLNRLSGIASVDQIERGLRTPTPETVRKIAAALGPHHPGYQRLMNLAKSLTAAEVLRRKAAGRAAWAERRKVFGPTGTRVESLVHDLTRQTG